MTGTGNRQEGSQEAVAGIDQIAGHHEGRTLEFKRDLYSLKGVLKTLVAFANTAGGTLVLGCDDEGRPLGLPGIDREQERLASSVADGISPPLLPDIEIAAIREVSVLVVRVARWAGPYYLTAEGPERGVYVRLGSTNRRAEGRALAELKRDLGRLAFDQIPCAGAGLQDLDLEAARQAFRSVGREVDQAKLVSLGVLVRHGRSVVPSHGGMLLFGREEPRARLFPDAAIRCARFAGTDRVEFLDRLDLEGTVLEALEDVPNFIRRNTRVASRIRGMRRKDVPEYPRVALREALVNAVAHADYTVTGMQIMVAVFQDRLEIQNPGTLPFGMTLADLEAGVSLIRNPVIARVLRELGLMEKWGSGYRRMAEDCAQGGYPRPEWMELARAVRVIFRPHPEVAAQPGRGGRDQVGTKSGPSRQQVELLEFASEPRTLLELMQRVGWSNRTKFRDKFIKPLLESGLLAMTIPEKPRSRAQRYVAVPQASAAGDER